MAQTLHLTARMNERGIPKELVELVLQYGRCQQDTYVLDRNGLGELLSAVRDLERNVLRALDKGGITVIEVGGQTITTYRRSSFDRKRARNTVRERY